MSNPLTALRNGYSAFRAWDAQFTQQREPGIKVVLWFLLMVLFLASLGFIGVLWLGFGTLLLPLEAILAIAAVIIALGVWMSTPPWTLDYWTAFVGCAAAIIATWPKGEDDGISWVESLVAAVSIVLMPLVHGVVGAERGRRALIAHPEGEQTETKVIPAADRLSYANWHFIALAAAGTVALYLLAFWVALPFFV